MDGNGLSGFAFELDEGPRLSKITRFVSDPPTSFRYGGSRRYGSGLGSLRTVAVVQFPVSFRFSCHLVFLLTIQVAC